MTIYPGQRSFHRLLTMQVPAEMADWLDMVAIGARPEPKHLAPPSPAVLLAVVEHVTSLAECGEVARPVVARVMVEMRAGQNHVGDRETRGRGDAGEVGLPLLEHMRWRQLAHPPAMTVTPGATLGVPPGAVAQVRDVLAVGAAAVLAAALSPGEADDIREFAPVDGIKPAVLGRDRHDQSLSPAPRRGNPDVGFVCSAVLPERLRWNRSTGHLAMA